MSPNHLACEHNSKINEHILEASENTYRRLQNSAIWIRCAMKYTKQYNEQNNSNLTSRHNSFLKALFKKISYILPLILAEYTNLRQVIEKVLF